MNTQYTQRWQSAPVLRSRDLQVVEGINIRQKTLCADDFCLGDVYRVAPEARSYRLAAFQGPKNSLIVSESTLLGAPGSLLRFECNLILISETGRSVDVCLIQETDPAGQIAEAYFLPDAPMDKAELYQLITIERTPRSDAALANADPQLPMDQDARTHKSDKARAALTATKISNSIHPK